MSDSRQRIAAGRAPSRFESKKPAVRGRSEEPMMRVSSRLLAILLLAGAVPALAQDPGTLDDKTAAAARTSRRAVRRRRKSCSAARPSPIRIAHARSASTPTAASPAPSRCRSTAPTWQVMRLSRNRNWGHPKLVAFLERLAEKAKKVGWNGLLVGDMSQPRGGPMLTGHASHQVGLDADIWLTPMPDRDADARGARIDVGDRSGRGGSARRRSEAVDARAHRAHPHCSGGSGGRAHLRQRGDQEGAVPRSRTRIAPGSPRCGHGGGTIIIFTSASIVRPTARNASRSRRRDTDEGCGHELDYWFSPVCCIRRRRPSRRSRSRGSRWRPCRPLAVRC